MKSMKKFLVRIADVLFVPAVYLAAYLFKIVRWIGVEKLPKSKAVLMKVGVYPILRRFYEPFIDSSMLRMPLDQVRTLPGIDLNIEEQLNLLKSFHFNEELSKSLLATDGDWTFHFDNGSFEPGDAEFLYNMIRLKQPARIVEIGSGNSTRVAIKAIAQNQQESPGYQCKHICIEPYAAPWLEKANVTVIRQRVELVDMALFSELGHGDLLFIDSTHMIRPQGDVLFEYLELLPTLKEGVIVHIHDIFTPRDYPEEWIVGKMRFWNEQYLMEAFLTCNPQWKVIGALNYLHRNHFAQLQDKCPFLTKSSVPASFYIEKVA